MSTALPTDPDPWVATSWYMRERLEAAIADRTVALDLYRQARRIVDYRRIALDGHLEAWLAADLREPVE